MKQQQSNSFKSKFQLLNSQPSSEEIIWSCSDSSDYENCSFSEINLKSGKRKRKQVKKKNNILKNTSNLNITIVDGTETNKIKKNENNIDNINACCKSPILSSSQRFTSFSRKSPVINLNSKENKQVSPVLVLKSSQKSLPKVRKKLFEHNSINIEKRRERSVSPVLTCTENVLKKSKTCDNQNISNGIVNNKDEFNVHRSIKNQVTNTKINKCLENEIYENTNSHIKQETQSLNGRKNLNVSYEIQSLSQDVDISIDNTMKNVALVDKVKSYFDSHFSSTSQSQHSISEYESKNSSKSNDDIEIINSLTEEKNQQNFKQENRSSDSLKSFDNVYVHKTKKVKYKKDGLAFRLSTLLKKQNASTSLWYHERYLAANSNFIVPKEEFVAFRIQKVCFKYGCYLLDALDVNNELCLIFVNNSYVKSNCMENDAIFKLYRPYKMLQFERYKLFINVCKYECIILKKL